MSVEQLVVLGLLAAAFAFGWVARGGDRGRDTDAGAERDTEADAGANLTVATTAYAAAVDAWLDRQPPDGPVAVFDAARAAVKAPPEAVEALADAAEVFERFRAGNAMTADDSARLEAVETRLGLSERLEY